jgi:hypothetical protein
MITAILLPLIFAMKLLKSSSASKQDLSCLVDLEAVEESSR